MSVRRITAACMVLALLVTVTAGCTSMKTIPPVSAPGSPPFGPVKAGDTVIVQTRSGERWRFVVQQVEGETIIAPGGQRYTRGEIAGLQRKSFSGPKTVGLVAAIVGGIFVAVGVAVASALGSLMG